jgi:tetratricopeptide (TPR) repeat protein
MILVLLATFAAFSPCLSNGFVYDDDKNIVANFDYRGLGGEQFRWMFTTFRMGHYQPLAWLSLAVDHAVWGMNPTGYHLTNLLLHLANTALVFLLVIRLARRARRDAAWGEGENPVYLAAALATLLFAVHPLRVESVAWVTERRDVLSSFFLLLTLLFYFRAQTASDADGKRGWLAAAMTAFVLSLLSRAMGVTLPLLLFVIDWHPLRRWGREAQTGEPFRRIVIEKLLFCIPAIPAVILAPIAQRSVGAAIAWDLHGPVARAFQACFGLVFYLVKTVFPAGLSPLYFLELPLDIGRWPIAVSAILVIVAIASVVMLRRHRWLVAAAVCYGVVLSPVLGFGQSGRQLTADRYSYLPAIVVAVLMTAGLARLLRGRGRTSAARIVVAATLAVGLGLGARTWRLCVAWRTQESLWRYAVEHGEANHLAHYNLACALAANDQPDEAVPHFERALALRPDHVKSQYNLGNALSELNRLEDSAAAYRRALVLDPTQGRHHYELGRVCLAMGREDEAMAAFDRAISLLPDDPRPRVNLGVLLNRRGRIEEAVAAYRGAIRLRPGHRDAHYNMAIALERLNRNAEAEVAYRQAIQTDPAFAEAYVNLGNVMGRGGRVEESRRLYQKALEISPGHPVARRNLDALEGRLKPPRR